MDRRHFLRLIGGSSVILAAGTATFLSTRTPTRALQPWGQAGSLYSDPMRWALSYAILAPNPHNRQPWMVDLISETEAVLYCDLDRLLPETDPFSRQIVIGLGCFLELFDLAAQEQGHTAQMMLFPDGMAEERLDQRPIAHLTLNADPNAAKDPLFSAIPHRHTNRDPYDIKRDIPASVLQGLTENGSNTQVAVRTLGNAPQRQTLRDLSEASFHTELTTSPAHMESVALMRIGKAEIEANPDGISLGGPLLESLNLLGQLDRDQLADPNSRAFQQGVQMGTDMAQTAMGYAWMTTNGNSRLDQIAAGRAYARLALKATLAGLAMQPLSQALQEYPEQDPYFRQIHELLVSNDAQRVQMFARLGYAKPIGPSPRWALETRIRKTAL